MPETLPDPLVVLAMMDEQPDLSPLEAVAPGRIELHHEPPAAFEDDAGMFPPPTGLKSFREPWHSDTLEGPA